MLNEHLKFKKDYFPLNEKNDFKLIPRNNKASGAIPEAVEMLFIGNQKSLQTVVRRSYLFPEYSRKFLKIEVIQR